MYTRPYTLIRKILHTIFLLSIVNSVLGLHGAPTVHAQDSQPIPLLTTNNVESPVPTASVGNIGTSFSTATLLGITGSPTGDFDYHGVNGVGNTSIEHYYKIAIGKTGVVKFRIVTALQSNHILRLYDNNYVLLDTGKDESCGLFCTYWNRKTISYNFTSTGIYFLRATYEDSIYLNYYLSWDYDGSSSSKALDVTGWDPGHPIEGFNDDRSYDWYFTNFSGGLYLRFSLLSDVGSNFNLYVYDQSNTSTPIASSTTTGIDIVDFTTPPSSVQYIKVVKATGSGGYRLEVSTPPPLCYTLTRSYTGSGSQPTANPANSTGCSSGQYTAGQSITMTAYPASGYSVGSWSGTNNNSSTSTTNTVTMPASALTVTANYVVIPPTCYTLTRSYTGSGSQPTANPANSTGCSSGQYTAGQSITMTAYPASGYSVGSWSGTNNNSSTSTTNTVTMPASALTVTANYVAIPPTCYTLTRSYTGSGSQPTANPANSTGCSSGQYTAGQSIAVTAYPASGYSVGSWSGTNNNSSTSTTNTVTMPASALTVTANYVAIPPTCYTLTRSYTGSGSQPTANPANSTGCSSGQYTAGQSIAVTAYPASGYSVGSWSGTNNNSSTSTTNTVTMPASALTVTANYVAIPSMNGPSGLTATPISSSQINLGWTDNSSDETNFRVERSPDGSTGWTEIGSAAANSPSYSSTGLSTCTTYYYRVRAYRSSDGAYSSYSNTASTTSTGCSLNAPSGLTATPISASQINLSWTDNSSDETNFRGELSLNGSTGWTEIGTVVANTTSASTIGLSACTTYYFRVRAYRSSDGAYSSYSNIANATTTGCSLNAPSGLTALPISSSQINLGWTDNSSDETNFRVESSPDGSTGWTEIGSVVANSPSYLSTGLSACTTYYYRVRAYRSSDGAYSSYGNTASATTIGCSLNAPSGLTAIPISASQINLSWTDNSSDETNFRVESSPDGSTGWTEIGSVVANSPSYSSTGLSACTTYYYRVRAYRSSDGAYSSYGNTANAQTSGCEPGGFNDVPPTYWAVNWIQRLFNAGITSGCGNGNYCPEDPVTRAQMAVFLERGVHGSDYQPPAVGSGTGFYDVPTEYWAAAWIKQLAADGITSGCGGGNYCPDDPVTRSQMAIFLLRAKYGAAYIPPGVGSNTGFNDVSVTHWAAAWIRQLAAEGITTGCGGGNYCPEDSVTRAQMAVFLVRTFNLP
jgi:hypothetical protein